MHSNSDLVTNFPVLDTRFIIGFDLAVTLSSSPVFSCHLFVIVWWQLSELLRFELKLLILKRRRRLFHSSRLKWPFANKSCKLVLCDNVSYWLSWGQMDLDKQPINCDSVSAGYVSHCWTSAFHNHFDHSFTISQKKSKSLLVLDCLSLQVSLSWIGTRYFNSQIPQIERQEFRPCFLLF